MSDRQQLPLDLGFRPALGREDFLVAPANGEAVAWIDRWPAWPAPALVLEGPAGAGKTHLAGVWRARAKAGMTDGAALTIAAAPMLVEAALVVEHADRAPEQPLLHLYNLMMERNCHLLLTARGAPARWGIALADLRSRLAALPVASISAPDEALIRAVLIKQFVDRQIIVSADLIDFLAVRLERSFDAASRIVAALDAASLAQQRRITVPLARDVLERGF